jgi:ABC-type multidrug transport system fused ATPase/permease subunit
MLIAANIIGFIVAKWRIILVAIGIFVVVFGVALLWKRCTPPQKLDEKQIEKGEKAKKDQNDAELKQILVESDVRSAAIDANTQDASARTVNAANESHKKWDNANRDEIQAEFDRRAQQR